MPELKAILEAGCEQLKINIASETMDRLLLHLKLVQNWNEAYNLTSIKSMRSMIIKHTLDSLSILPYLKGKYFVDVGSGAGFPGIPLACVASDKRFFLVEPNKKKANFLDVVRIRLKLENLVICPNRIEDLKWDHLVDGVISRAFSAPVSLYEKVEKHLNSTGILYAMLGQYDKSELEDKSERVRVEIRSLTVPFIEAARHLLIVQKKA